MNDLEKDVETLVNNILEFRDLKCENSILKAILKYKKPCLTCSKETAVKLSKIASNLNLESVITNIGNSQYKIIVWKNDNN